MLGYSKYFDQPFDAKPAKIGLTVFGVATSLQMLLTTRSTCMAQYDIKDTWTGNYGIAEASEKFLAHPMVAATIDNTPDGAVPEIFRTLSLLFPLNSFRANLNSHYYYFFAGLTAGGWMGNVITVSDVWFSLGLITPEDPWDRYNNE